MLCEVGADWKLIEGQPADCSSVGHGSNAAVPAKLFPDAANPLGFAQVVRLGDVVDAPGLTIDHHARNRRGHVVDIRAGVAPGGDAPLQQDHGAAIGHPSQVAGEPVVRITRTVDHRQADDRRRNRPARGERLLHWNLVVVIQPSTRVRREAWRAAAIREAVAAQRRRLIRCSVVDFGVLSAQQDTERPIDAAAADHDRATGQTVDRGGHRLRVGSIPGSHVDDDIGTNTADEFSQWLDLCAITVGVVRPGRNATPGATVEYHDVVAVECSGNTIADEAGTTGDHDMHDFLADRADRFLDNGRLTRKYIQRPKVTPLLRGYIMATPQDSRKLLDRMEALNKAMPDFRKAESTVKGLKADVAAQNVRIGLSDSNVSAAELSRLVERFLDAW